MVYRSCSHSCCRGMNDFLHECYTADRMYMTQEQGNKARGHLRAFFRNYIKAAELSRRNGEVFWNLTPKFHYLMHVEDDMAKQLASDARRILNPCLFSTAMAEDSVGRLCILSRTVHPNTMPMRVAQKYMLDAKQRWCGKKA